MRPLGVKFVRILRSVSYSIFQCRNCITDLCCSSFMDSPLVPNRVLYWPFLSSNPIRFSSNNALVSLKIGSTVPRFCIGEPDQRTFGRFEGNKANKKGKMSRKKKLNELRFFRLKAKKKMKSSNPEVRIRYKLEKAKRKEEWLIAKLRKFEIPRGPVPIHDPESLTEEEIFYLKRTGEKKKNYVNVGRRGVFGGVVLNMHLHWKKHETVKVVCRPCRPGQVHQFAEEIARLSKGTIIDIKADNTIIFYRGKNYIQPDIMSPPCTLSKQKALEKYKFEQSLEHTSQFIEKLEEELEDYLKYLATYKNNKGLYVENSEAKLSERFFPKIFFYRGPTLIKAGLGRSSSYVLKIIYISMSTSCEKSSDNLKHISSCQHIKSIDENSKAKITSLTHFL